MNGIGYRILKLRTEQDLTLAELASKLGVSKPTVWAWEKGRAKPSRDRLPAIAEALGKDVDYLVPETFAENFEAVMENAKRQIADFLQIDLEKVRVNVEF